MIVVQGQDGPNFKKIAQQNFYNINFRDLHDQNQTIFARTIGSAKSTLY
jgi:hypothetical protein